MVRTVPAHKWLPLLAPGAPIPRTLLVAYNGRKVVKDVGHGGAKAYRDLCLRVELAAARIGHPVFIRHEGKSCAGDNPRLATTREPDDIPRALGCALAVPGAARSRHIIVRKLLPLIAPFETTGGRLVSREFVIHADSGAARCMHPAWDAGIPAGLEREFRDLFTLTVDEQADLASLCSTYATALDGAWRIEVGQGTDRKWWILNADRAALCKAEQPIPVLVRL